MTARDTLLDEIESNRRYDRMFDAVAIAKATFSRAVSPSERSAGWTDDLVREVVAWIARCEDALSRSRHPPDSIVGSWGRWLTDVPGEAFDRGSKDKRADRLLDMDIAIHVVHEIEVLYADVAALMDALGKDLPLTEAANGWTDEIAGAIVESLSKLRQLLASGRDLRIRDSERWRDTLTGDWPQWQNGSGWDWKRGDRGPRFWVDRPGSLWQQFGRIDRLFNAVASM